MVGEAIVTDRCSAAWRCALSGFEEKTRPCLIQTGVKVSSSLKHGPMVGDGRSLRRTDIIDLNLQYQGATTVSGFQYQIFICALRRICF